MLQIQSQEQIMLLSRSTFMNFTAVLAQIKPKLGCVADNLVIIEDRIRKAVADQADLIIFPELAVTGYFLKDLVPDVALRIDSPQILKLAELSRDISIAVGFVEVTDDYRFFNSAVYLEEGRIKHLHRKVVARSSAWVASSSTMWRRRRSASRALRSAR
jgi:predicted amidohydrolase